MPQLHGGTESIAGDEEVVTRLTTRVLKLERKVDSLESELRLVRRKVRAMDTSRYGYDIIADTVQRVLNDNSWNISKNRSRKNYSTDEEDDESFRKRMKHRYKHSKSKSIIVPSPRPPPPRQQPSRSQEQELRQKRKYKALLDNEGGSDYVPDPDDELSDDMKYPRSSKVRKRNIKVEKPVTVTIYKPKSQPGPGILKKENLPAAVKVENEDPSYDKYERRSTTGRKPKNVWVNFTTQRDDSGKVTSSICKLCKQRVSARPYRMDQHLATCSKRHGKNENNAVIKEEADTEDGDGISSSMAEGRSGNVVVKKDSVPAQGRPKQKIWSHFTTTKVRGQQKEQCNYCSGLISARAPRLRQHILNCPSYVKNSNDKDESSS